MQEQQIRLKQEQKQILTPAQLQALTLLALPAQELDDYINGQLLENPLLEVKEEVHAEAIEPAEPPKREEREDDNWHEDKTAQTVYEDWGYGKHGGALLREVAAEPNDLIQQLLLQAAFLNMSGATERAARAIIYALDGDGYLRVSLEEMAAALNMSEDILAAALTLVQTLEPRGVAARDLRECLTLQLQDQPEPELPLLLVESYLPELADGRLRQVAKSCGVSETEVEEAFARIRALEPRPAASLSWGGPVQYIVPDLSVQVEDKRLYIRMNDSFRTMLTINEYYASLTTDRDQDEQLKEYLHHKLAAAKTLIKNVERRHDTISAIAEIVFTRQRDFFTEGMRGMKPLTMKETAELAGIHESTVSRAVAGKYVETPRGLLPWKFFFPRALELDDGRFVSDAYAKSLIAGLISSEDKKKPLSDRELADLLNEQGLPIARRTVAKYRAMLGLPGQSQRRANN